MLTLSPSTPLGLKRSMDGADNKLRDAIAHFKTDCDQVKQIFAYGLRLEGMKQDLAAGATKQPAGQITRKLSSPAAKNIPLSPSGKSVI